MPKTITLKTSRKCDGECGTILRPGEVAVQSGDRVFCVLCWPDR